MVRKINSGAIQLLPVHGIGEVSQGDDIGKIIVQTCSRSRLKLQNNDILVVTHKIVSKAEGRVYELDTFSPSKFAIKVGRHIGKDPRQVEAILSESRRLVKVVKGLIISENSLGFVCANAGVDQSNVTKGSVELRPN